MKICQKKKRVSYRRIEESLPKRTRYIDHQPRPSEGDPHICIHYSKGLFELLVTGQEPNIQIVRLAQLGQDISSISWNVYRDNEALSSGY